MTKMCPTLRERTRGTTVGYAAQAPIVGAEGTALTLYPRQLCTRFPCPHKITIAVVAIIVISGADIAAIEITNNARQAGGHQPRPDSPDQGGC